MTIVRLRGISLALAASLATACAADKGAGSRTPDDPRAKSAPPADADAPRGWKRVQTDDAFASIVFPDNWDIQVEQGVEEESGLAYGEWQAEDRDTIYYLGTESLGGVVDPESGQEDELMLAFVNENLEALGGRLLGQQRVYLDGFLGVGYDIAIDTEEGEHLLIGRMYLVGDVRVLAFWYGPDSIEDEAELFLSSLRLGAAAETRVLEAHGPGWGELVLGNAAWTEGDLAAAVDWYRKAIAAGVFEPNFAGVIEDRRARLLFAQSRYEETRASLDAAKAMGYETYTAARIRAAMHVREENYEAAVAEYDRIIADGGGDLDIAIARVEAQAGKLGQARTRLDEGIGSRGDVDVMLNTLATDIDEALVFAPASPRLRVWRALVREAVGDRQGALLDMRRALAADPDSFGARVGWGWKLLGESIEAHGKSFGGWLAEREPRDAHLRWVLAEMWTLAKDWKASSEIFEALAAGDESSPQLICRVGHVYNAMHDEPAALAKYARAFEVNPDYTPCRNALAWLLATGNDAGVRDGKRAVEVAKPFAYDGDTLLDREDMAPGRVDTLAAAYAEAGEWEQAVSMQTLALELARENGREEEALAEYVERLEGYKGKKPWREPVEDEAPEDEAAPADAN